MFHLVLSGLVQYVERRTQQSYYGKITKRSKWQIPCAHSNGASSQDNKLKYRIPSILSSNYRNTDQKTSKYRIPPYRTPPHEGDTKLEVNLDIKSFDAFLIQIWVQNI